MTHDDGPRELPLQLTQQGQQGGFLCQRARVARITPRIQPALVAEADAVAVVVQTMGADVLQRSAAVDGAVARHVIVIADVLEAPVTDVVRAAGFKVQAPPLTGGGTVDNDQSDASHRLLQATGIES